MLLLGCCMALQLFLVSGPLALQKFPLYGDLTVALFVFAEYGLTHLFGGVASGLLCGLSNKLSLFARRPLTSADWSLVAWIRLVQKGW